MSGRRVNKNVALNVLVASPTRGDFKLTPKLQKMLGVADGDFAVVLENDGKFYLAKGITGTLSFDENGSPVRDNVGKYVYEPNTCFGSVLRQAAPGSQLLKMTQGGLWNSISGDPENSYQFELGAPQEAELMTDWDIPTPYVTEVYEILVPGKKVKKTVKGQGASTTSKIAAESTDIEDMDADFEDEGFEMSEE